jgi:hypothetical protein
MSACSSCIQGSPHLSPVLVCLFNIPPTSCACPATLPCPPAAPVCYLQLSGVTERRRQLEGQLAESATANNALSVQVGRVELEGGPGCGVLQSKPYNSTCVLILGQCETKHVLQQSDHAEQPGFLAACVWGSLGHKQVGRTRTGQEHVVALPSTGMSCLYWCLRVPPPPPGCRPCSLRWSAARRLVDPQPLPGLQP